MSYKAKEKYAIVNNTGLGLFVESLTFPRIPLGY